jgi:hypothetical protein
MNALGLKVTAGCLRLRMEDLVRPAEAHAANERFAKLLEKHLVDLLTFLCR